MAATAQTQHPVDEIIRLVPMLGWILAIAGASIFVLGALRLVASLGPVGSGSAAGATQMLGGAVLAVVGGVFAQLIQIPDQQATPPPSPQPHAETSSGPSLWIIAGVVAASLVVLAGVVIVGLRVHESRSRHRAFAEGVRATWAEAATILGAVDADYAAYHADLADRLFVRPLLDDTTDPHTAAFLDAHTAAHVAAYESQPLDGALAETAVSTARAAREAWNIASRHARSAGLQIEPRKRSKLALARKLLNQALDPTITDDYRDNLLDRITALIAQAGASRIPPVRALVADAVIRQLDAGSPRQLTRGVGGSC